MTTPAHPLQPDLAAIREFGKLASHDQRTEAQAAMALYEDICWRAAMVPLPPQTAQDLARLEADAAGLTRRYMATELDAATFWQDLARLVEHMRVRDRPGEVVVGQPPVEVRGPAQRGQRIRRAGREPPAPQCTRGSGG